MSESILSVLSLGESIIKRIWPDPEMQELKKMELQKLASKGDESRLAAQVNLMIAQLEVNKVEAQSKSVFVSGWRPFIGWVCGLGLAYNVIAAPFLGIWFNASPVASDYLYPVLMGILGLGGFRTFEKSKGVSRPGI